MDRRPESWSTCSFRCKAENVRSGGRCFCNQKQSTTDYSRFFFHTSKITWLLDLVDQTFIKIWWGGERWMSNIHIHNWLIEIRGVVTVWGWIPCVAPFGTNLTHTCATWTGISSLSLTSAFCSPPLKDNVNHLFNHSARRKLFACGVILWTTFACLLSDFFLKLFWLPALIDLAWSRLLVVSCSHIRLCFADTRIRLEPGNDRHDWQLLLLGVPGHADSWRVPGVQTSSEQVWAQESLGTRTCLQAVLTRLLSHTHTHTHTHTHYKTQVDVLWNLVDSLEIISLHVHDKLHNTGVPVKEMPLGTIYLGHLHRLVIAWLMIMLHCDW